MKRIMLFRWWKRTQLDIQVGYGFLCLGLDRGTPRWMSRLNWRLIAYYSPDATPVHPRAKGWGADAVRKGTGSPPSGGEQR
jgi:hypothetical protein